MPKFHYPYNGKELNEEFGLNFYDYGARWYDAGMGSWWEVDPMADQYYKSSPFNYGENNPVSNIDPNGQQSESISTRFVDPSGHTLLNTNDGRNDVYQIEWKDVPTFQLSANNSGEGTDSQLWNNVWRSRGSLLIHENVVNLQRDERSLQALIRTVVNGFSNSTFSDYLTASLESSWNDQWQTFPWGSFFRGIEYAKFLKITAKSLLSRVERLSLFKNALENAPSPKNPKEALKLINKSLDAIERVHARANDRMFGILDDKYVTYHPNGNVTALTKGHRIEIQSNGTFSIFERKTGDLFFSK